MKPARHGETVLWGGFLPEKMRNTSKTRNETPQKHVTKHLKNA